MSTATAQPAEAPEAALEPFRGDCPVCGREVLAVTVRGREVVVDVAEVLPEGPCEHCASAHARGFQRECGRCGGRGVIGEPLPVRGVLIDALGRARRWPAGRREGECIHALHSCG